MKTILILEDDAIFRSRLQKAFEKRGLRVLASDHLDDAVKTTASNAVDFAVVDLRLAEESGLIAIERLHALKPELKIVMLTGYGSIATTVEAMRLGACNYLTKPANADEILQALHQEQGAPPSSPHPQAMSLSRLEWEYIQRVLTECDGNISQAARLLGLHRRSLQRKLAKFPVAR